MCESCEHDSGVSRRTFLQAGTMLSGSAVFASSMTALQAGVTPQQSANTEGLPPLEKRKTRMVVLFMYPPAEVVQEGKFEDSWAVNKWFTYPGNQFNPQKNHRLFKEKIAEFTAPLQMDVEFVEPAVYTTEAVAQFTAKTNANPPDVLLIVNFWNTMSPWVLKMTQEIKLPIIVYHPVGANHQLPPQGLMTAEGVYYIHSVRNWSELNGAIRSANAKNALAQSRLLRVTDSSSITTRVDPNLGVEIVSIPAQKYNDLFDSIQPDDKLATEAMAFKAKAVEVIGVEDRYFVEAFRAHTTVQGIMQRYGADAITIKCLMLQHRKPCISFSLHNSGLIPCACEDFPDSAMTMMLGSLLFARGGFMHNPEFDINYNQYYGSHCTSALQLHGPGQKEVAFKIRPFTHHQPPTPALDLQFEPGQKIFVAKYLPQQNKLFAFTGEMVGSVNIEIAGGCASRFLMNVDKLEDVCDMYHGPHPIMYYGDKDQAKWLKTFSKLYKMDWAGNV